MRSSFSTALAMTVAVLLSTASASAQTLDIDDLTARAPNLSAAEKAAGGSFLKMYEERLTRGREAGQVDWAMLSKLACEAAVNAPTAKALSACGEARLGAVRAASNPQPSAEEAQASQETESAALLEASLSLDAANGTLPHGDRARLTKAVECLRQPTDDRATADCGRASSGE